MARKLVPPPSTTTGELGVWLREVHRLIESTPNFSVASFGATATPNSAVTGRSGDVLVNVGSGATDGRLWQMGGNTGAALTQTGWVPIVGNNGSATPTGAAGGVLSGTYPDPGFAVDMATQAELDAVEAALEAYADAAVATHAALTAPHSATAVNTASRLVLRDASGNFAAGTITAALSGNATTATTLQNTRTLWGQNFNGSANVTGALSSVTDITFSGTISGGSTVSATTLTGTLSTAAQPNVTSVGTLTSLTTSGAIKVVGDTGVYIRNAGDTTYTAAMGSVFWWTSAGSNSEAAFATSGSALRLYTGATLGLTVAAGAVTIPSGLTVSAGTTAVQALTATTGTFTANGQNLRITSTASGTFGSSAYAQWFRADNATARGYVGFGSADDQTFSIATQSSGTIRLAAGNDATIATFSTTGLAMNSLALSGVTTLTATGLIQTTVTTEQMRLRYDASNYLAVTVSSTGGVDANMAGTAGVVFTVKNNGTAAAAFSTQGNVFYYPVSTPASTASQAGINIPHGTAPSSPFDGEMWTTTAGAFIRINGVTKTFTLT